MTPDALPALIPLRTPVINSDWGSHTMLAALQGRPQSARPEAELWIGAHAKAPSTALLPAGAVALDRLLDDRAAELLGHEDASESGLPFLLKLLAVERPLSIQVHPDAKRARAGWDAEEELGIARDASSRTFVDSNGKPEVFAALTPSVILCGFRPLGEAQGHLRAIGWASIADAEHTTGSLFLRWLRQVTASGDTAAKMDGIANIADPEVRELTQSLASLHPGDPAALAPVFMNIVHLAPREMLVVDPGTVHAAVHGFGVEAMASSDNVARAGLTAKHRALDAFEQLADLHAHAPDVRSASPAGDGWNRFITSHREFQLTYADVRDAAVSLEGFAALLGVEGTLLVESADASLQLQPGDACLVRAGSRATVSGTGLVYACSTPRGN